MSAFPYMPLYVADYLADTSHLSTLENGAYLMLIMNYWQRGEALPASDMLLSRIARLTPKEWAKVKPSLAEFFSDDGSTWVHHRIEIELAKFRARPPQKEWEELRRFVFQRDNYTCQYCGRRGGNLECDHVVPASNSGPAIASNLATACKTCNRSKGSKSVESWMSR